MVRWLSASIVTPALLALAAPALAATCQVGKVAEIPLTMTGRRAVVTAQINGRDARFILDSGAFYSTIAQANAQEYGLKLESLNGAMLSGIGGSTSLWATTVKDFRIAGQTVPRVEFGVGGSDTGFAGLLGQNFLGLADAEYDLPHGFVRLMHAQGCHNANLAYWAGAKPVALVEIMPMDTRNRHTIGTVTVNGVKLKAMFDTGATSSMITLAAAKRAGITPDSPGVTSTGFAYGVGTKRVAAWRARFTSIEIGGETINRPWIDIGDQLLPDADMLIGIDFFLTHRIYVDNKSQHMFVTYEGGPVFGLDPKGAVDEHGAALDLTDKTGEPTGAAGYATRGAVLASKHDLDAALADFDKAVSMAPNEAHYVWQRAMVHLAKGQPLLAAADIDKTIALAPNDPDPRLARARMRLAARDPAGALEDLKAADAALAPSADARLRLAAMYDSAEAYAPALASYDQWLRSHPEDHSRAPAFNGRCWARALMNQELDKALSDCDAALRLRPGETAYLDSRALVHMRRGEYDKAIADYDAAIAAKPREAWSLYARAIAERHAGKAAQADTDRTAALAINPRVADRAKRFHLDD
ncbi:aspartyl protease family protein [Sphingomonas sp. MMS24-J13]|uniref:aspartyl protease family protein n=1 Tax=Sphingomonas sp. MMS24-J13 TaxID=3238686 RepID=UPI00384F8B3C